MASLPLHMRFRPLALAALAVLGASAAAAQNLNSSGASWNTSWGFSSTADRQLGLSQAQAIRNARSGSPSTVVYNTTNNTTTNTNTVGAMNTGDTTVTVTGDGNRLTTTSAADSTGCLDGSVTSLMAEGSPDSTGHSVSFTGATAAKSCY